MVSAKCLFTQNLLPFLQTQAGHGANCCFILLGLKDEFSGSDHPIIKHFPHFLFVPSNQYQEPADSGLRPNYSCGPSVPVSK